MSTHPTLLLKELTSYLTRINLYIIFGIYLLLSGLFLWVLNSDYNILQLGKANMDLFFELSPWLMFFIIPGISMGALSEEDSNGTLRWLFAQPISLLKIILSKFIALKIILFLLLAPTLFYVYVIEELSLEKVGIDFGLLLTAYFGLFLLGVLFISISLFCSSLSKSQRLVYVTALLIEFFLFYGIESLTSLNLLSENEYWIQKIGVSYHYNQWVEGIIDTSSLGYLLSLILFFIILSTYNLSLKKK